MGKQSEIAEYIHALKAAPRLKGQVAFSTVIREKPPELDPGERPMAPPMEKILEAMGIERLYRHQAESVEQIRLGHDVAVATATASGKTLIYNLSVVERILRNPESRALYIYPLKALAQDQLSAFRQFVSPLGTRAPEAAIYDGDTSAWHRRKIRDRPPNVVMTNPEMLHLSILAYHAKWEPVLSSLETVVLDEAHTYRGIFGAHVAQIYRRLSRICDFYGSDPSFVFSSATLANPGQLANMLTGRTPTAIAHDGAPSGRRFVVLMDPVDSPARTAILLLQAALHRGLRTIVFTRSRKMTELIALWARQQTGRYADRIAAYRAGFLPDERRAIEARLAGGELLAVVSTSALELGIDIGDLDLCILVGYPGSIITTWQRTGRVGCNGQDSALVFIAGDNALDRFWLRHPGQLLTQGPEACVVNPYNTGVLERHLVCAAAELPITENEPMLADDNIKTAVRQLESDGRLLRSADGGSLYSPRKAPHRTVDLRSAGSQYMIVDAGTDDRIGEIDSSRVFRETHPGGVYLHRGETYLVEAVDTARRVVRASAARVGYYTRVIADKDIRIVGSTDEHRHGDIRFQKGRIRVTDQVTAYETRDVRSGERLEIVSLDLPPVTFETDGLWFDLPASIERAVQSASRDFWGGIHALEHAAIGIFPLLVLADQNDLGGIATPLHPQLGNAAIFIYDGIPGGAGLCDQAFDRLTDLFRFTAAAVFDCPCEEGCPACVHSPQCGNQNRPIDKKAALLIAKAILQQLETQPQTDVSTPQVASVSAPHDRPRQETGRSVTPSTDHPDFGVLDIETQRSAAEVGGWHRADRMKVSCAVLYDSRSDRFLEYQENQVADMIRHMRSLSRVIGFNVKRFDYKVIEPYTDEDLGRLPTLDILEDVHRQLGFRLSLDHLAKETLDRGKTADGLQALKWWREGRMREILDYCRMDVEITRDLYLFGLKNRYLLFRNKAGERLRIPVDW
ncbi:ATP-dependent RNA helicase, DEAD/DEAH box family [Olavius algarvensis associated proteobacterium Delta 3]|nr:ATP-dependent RNA helicase, DEAD/DEAH box family [Olavius algarvensis associated proteobacterium Delta 3]